MNTITERLDAAMHRIPGVPAHDPRRNARSPHARSPHAHASTGHARHSHRTHHRDAEPRVLVRWQRWIASLGARP
jgi:hypothetical protein